MLIIWETIFFWQPAASIVIVLFFIFNESSNIGIAVISFDLLSTCSSPIIKPFSWHHALTECRHLEFSLLLPRKDFPSTAIWSLLLLLFSTISAAWVRNKFSILFGSNKLNTLLNVSLDGTPFLKLTYRESQSLFTLQ